MCPLYLDILFLLFGVSLAVLLGIGDILGENTTTATTTGWKGRCHNEYCLYFLFISVGQFVIDVIITTTT
jgi:hypothetical protein